jgi:transcriptional regulator with PAS, ATPase and Fis domain
VRDEVVRHAFRMARQSGEALVAVDSRGRVIAVNDVASRRRIVEAGALPASAELAIARALGSPGMDGELSIELPHGTVIASAVRHDETAVGAILRIRPNADGARPARSRALPGHASSRYELSQILGHSVALERALALAETAARNDLPVVLSGESGTGKELFAHSIHAASLRRSGPFVAVNCGSIPAPMIESELFGYEAGAFTGARREGNAGRCEDASGGTLFLDEVCELSPQAQTALLRVLQEKEVVRLGGSTTRAVDIRIVAATNRPLEDEVRAKRFRSDLYYRLNVLSIQVPPLRERGDDIALLAEAFLQEAKVELGREELALGSDAVEALRAHSWPGNVRELKNVIQRACATAPGAIMTASDLALEAGGLEVPVKAREAAAPAERPVREAVITLEREALVEAVVACHWNLAHAAQKLGISRMTLYRWMRKHGIARPGSAG